VTVSATASDNIGVVGVSLQVDGATIGSEDTTRPYSIVWNTTGLTDGTHTLTAVARDAAGNTGTSAPVTVTVVNGAAGPSVDVTAFGDRATASSTVVTSAFSTTAGNELLLAFVGSDQATGTPITVTGVTGGGLTWQLVVRSNVQLGTAEVWRAFAAAPLTNASVTATLSQSVSSSITVVGFKGTDVGQQQVRRDQRSRGDKREARRAVGDADHHAREVARVRRRQRFRQRAARTVPSASRWSISTPLQWATPTGCSASAATSTAPA
jgi:hypothetical protein